MNSGKISLKEGFDFLFEEDETKKSDQKIKLIYNDQTAVTQKNAILYALSFDIFEAVINNREKTSLQLARMGTNSRKKQGLDSNDNAIYAGTGIKIAYMLKPSVTDLTRATQFVNNMNKDDDVSDTVSANSVKTYIEKVAQAYKILSELGADKLQLEAKEENKKFTIKINKAIYDRLVSQILEGRLASFLSASDGIITYKIDVLHQKLSKVMNRLIKTSLTRTKSGESHKQAQAAVDKKQEETRDLERTAMVFETWVDSLTKGSNKLYQLKKTSINRFKAIKKKHGDNYKDSDEYKDYVEAKKKDFDESVFGNATNKQKMLDAIRQNKFDFIVYILSCTRFRRATEKQGRGTDREYSSQIQDRAFIKLLEMLYGKTVSDEVMQKILTQVNNFKQSKKKVAAKNIYRTKEYKAIKKLLASEDTTPAGLTPEEVDEKEQEQQAQASGALMEPVISQDQDGGTQSEELSGETTGEEESSQESSSTLEIINVNQMVPTNGTSRVWELEESKKQEELKKIVSILLTAEIYGALNNIDKSTIFQTSVGQKIMLKDAFRGVTEFLAAHENVSGVKEFSTKVNAAKSQLGGSPNVQLSLVEAIAPKYVLTMSHGTTTALIMSMINNLESSLEGKFDAGDVYKQIFAASNTFKISFSVREESSTQDDKPAKEADKLSDEEKDSLKNEYKEIAGKYNRLLKILLKGYKKGSINTAKIKAKSLQACTILTSLLDQINKICKEINVSQALINILDDRGKKISKLQSAIEAITLDDLTPKEEKVIDQEVEQKEDEIEQTSQEIDEMTPGDQPDAINQELEDAEETLSDLASGVPPKEKSDEGEVDSIVLDKFYTSYFVESHDPVEPITNGLCLMALHLKYDKNLNISEISSYHTFKQKSLESLKYLCDKNHIKDNSGNSVTYDAAAMKFTKISAKYNSDIESVILTEDKDYRDEKISIEIHKSKLKEFAETIPDNIGAMSNLCQLFLNHNFKTNQVFTQYYKDDDIGNINTSVTLDEITSSVSSGEAKLDLDSAQLSNENKTTVIPVNMGDDKTVVRADFNNQTSEIEFTAPNGDSKTIPFAPEMNSVSKSDDIILQLQDALELDTALSDESQVDVQGQRDSYEESYQNKDSVIESIISSKEFNNIITNFVSGESKAKFADDLKESLDGDIINDIKNGKNIARIQAPLSKMMMNYQISTGPIKSIMKNILKKDEDDLRAIVKLSMLGSTKKLYQDQFDLQLSNVVRAAFEQNVYGSTTFNVSESLLREGFLTGIKNLSSDLAQGLKNLWAGKDSVEKAKMVTALGGLGGTLIGAAPVAAGLYTVSAALGLGRRFAKEVPEEKAARKDWFPEGQTILKMILEDKESDKFIATLVKTNIINTIIKLINPEYKFRSTAADPKKLQPVVEEFLEHKEEYEKLTDEQKELFKSYSYYLHDKISKMPWADYGANSQYGEFAIVSRMHVNRLINNLFLTDGGIEYLNYAAVADESYQEQDFGVEAEIYDRLNYFIKKMNIKQIYASRLRQVVKKRSSLVKGNISNWFKDRVSPKWKTTVYAEFSSKILKDVLNIEYSFMPKKSGSLKDKIGAYASNLGKERSDENYLGYSLEELLFENIIFENSNIFLNEENVFKSRDEEIKAKTREEIDDESVRDTESTAEDLLTGISPTLEFLTMQLEKENLYQSLVVRDYLPYTTTELKTQMTQARDYVDTAQEAVKLQSSMPKQDFINRWYELEPNDAGEGQEIISWWYSTKKYAGTPKQLHLAYRNTTTGEIKMIGGAEEAEKFGWTEVLKENGLKIDGTNGVTELPNCDAKLVDLNDDSVISEFMTDLKSNFVGSYHEQILKTSEPMTVEEYIDKTQEKFMGSESGLHLVLPNDKSPDMLEKIALTSAKNEQFMLMKIKAGIKAGKLTGEVPPELLSGTKKGLVEFNLSEKMLKKAGVNEKTLDKFEEFRYKLEQARIDYMQSEGEGPISLERMYVQAYKETVGTLPVGQKEELVSAIVKVKGEAANAGLNLAVKNVSHEETVEVEVTKYKATDREIQVPIDKSSEIGRALEKFYDFSSILRTTNMVTSIGTLLWKRGIDHALFQKHFMKNIRLDDAIQVDLFNMIAGNPPVFTNASDTTQGIFYLIDPYANPAISDIASAAEDVVTAGVSESSLVYTTNLTSFLFENKLVEKTISSFKAKNENLVYSEEINEHNELKDLFKKLF